MEFAGFDISYEEVKELCREAWKHEECNWLFFEISEKIGEGK